jgi:hypothetical protein
VSGIITIENSPSGAGAGVVNISYRSQLESTF